MAGSKKRVGKLVFSIVDPYGNPVYLTEESWKHITLHLDMIGLQSPLKATIKSPTGIYQSLTHDDRLVFMAENVLAPRTNVMRAVVGYDDISVIKAGSTSGEIITAFTPSWDKRLSGNVGPVLYEKPRKGRRR